MSATPTEKDNLKDRLLEAAVALLSAAEGKQLLTTNLNKGIFYLDLCSLRDCGETVTGSAFIALERGPVVAKYEQRLIAPLTASGMAIQAEQGPALPVRLLKELNTWRFLTAHHLNLARKIGMECSKISATSVSDLAHKNPGWIIAWNEGVKADGRPKAIDMNIALQQVMDADPWMKEAFTSDSHREIAAAENGEGKVW